MDRGLSMHVNVDGHRAPGGEPNAEGESDAHLKSSVGARTGKYKHIFAMDAPKLRAGN